MLLAMSLRLGGARTGTQLQVVCSDSLSVSTPASAPVVFPSSGAAGSCHRLGHLSQAQRTPSGLHGSRFSTLWLL